MSKLEHYEIIGYEETFEVSQSKKYKNLTWFPSPNKYDSGGMLETLSEEKGLSYIGVWYLVLQLASTMPKRGVFLSDSGKPLSLKRIGMTLRIDFALLSEAFEHFKTIGWVDTTSELGANYEQARSELGAREDKIRIDKIKEESVVVLESEAEKSTHTQNSANANEPKNIEEVIEHAGEHYKDMGVRPSTCKEFFDKWSASGWLDSNLKPFNWKMKFGYFVDGEDKPKVVISKKNEHKPIIPDYHKAPVYTDEELEAFDDKKKNMKLPWEVKSEEPSPT